MLAFILGFDEHMRLFIGERDEKNKLIITHFSHFLQKKNGTKQNTTESLSWLQNIKAFAKYTM